eukprot:5620995-Prymnesium_polylepis.1
MIRVPLCASQRDALGDVQFFCTRGRRCFPISRDLLSDAALGVCLCAAVHPTSEGIAVYNRYVTGLGPAAGARGAGAGESREAKAQGPAPLGMRQQPNTSLAFWCYGLWPMVRREA